jgi:hypothetical protein
MICEHEFRSMVMVLLLLNLTDDDFHKFMSIGNWRMTAYQGGIDADRVSFGLAK